MLQSSGELRPTNIVPTNILELLKVLTPEDASKWDKWAEQLKAEDVDNKNQLCDLNKDDFNNLRISAYLKHTLRKHRDEMERRKHNTISIAQRTVADYEDTSKQTKPEVAPTGIWRWLKLVSSPFELLIPADHYPAYAKHWIESRREDGPNLHEGMLFLYEVEIIVSSLLLGVFTTLFFEVIHESMIEDFMTHQVYKLDYYVVLFGIMSI
ncbi:hypothetical protein CYMTET_39768 [Cymbomonas tetramitiformis]|uniref:Uncharacterized protein n=1 Tax=Cymbomonas tetramitiformis TaxID=36881 RepID=A0AAE0C9H2_9CHLO|nr:hypothetical protein CYMTET_39768 [Cymbomonas tetramitiformis]